MWGMGTAGGEDQDIVIVQGMVSRLSTTMTPFISPLHSTKHTGSLKVALNKTCLQINAHKVGLYTIGQPRMGAEAGRSGRDRQTQQLMLNSWCENILIWNDYLGT